MDSSEKEMNPVAMTIIGILGEPGIEPSTSCPQVLYAIDRATQTHFGKKG